MSKYGPGDFSFVVVGGYQLVSNLTGLNIKKSAALEDTRGLGSVWPTPEDLGTRSFELSHMGWYDDAADAINAAVESTIVTSAIVSMAPAGNTVGKPFIGCEGPFKADYERMISLEGFHKATAMYRGSGRVDEGVVLQPRAVKAADWDTEGGDSHDHGSSTTAGAAAYLQVEDLDLDGADALDVTVRHSADDSTYAELLTFALVATERNAQRVPVAAGVTINRHTAVSGDFTGTPGTPATTVSVGFARY